MLAEGAIHFAFKQAVKRIFFIGANVLGKAFDEDAAARIVSDLKILVLLHRFTAGFARRQQVANSFVVDLGVTDANCNSLVKSG